MYQEMIEYFRCMRLHLLSVLYLLLQNNNFKFFRQVLHDKATEARQASSASALAKLTVAGAFLFEMSSFLTEVLIPEDCAVAVSLYFYRK